MCSAGYGAERRRILAVGDLTHAAGARFFEEGARQRRSEQDGARLRGLTVGAAGPSEHDVDLLVEDGFDDEARRSLAEVEGPGRGWGRAKGAQLLAADEDGV